MLTLAPWDAHSSSWYEIARRTVTWLNAAVEVRNRCRRILRGEARLQRHG